MEVGLKAVVESIPPLQETEEAGWAREVELARHYHWMRRRYWTLEGLSW